MCSLLFFPNLSDNHFFRICCTGNGRITYFVLRDGHIKRRASYYYKILIKYGVVRIVKTLSIAIYIYKIFFHIDNSFICRGIVDCNGLAYE